MSVVAAAARRGYRRCPGPRVRGILGRVEAVDARELRGAAASRDVARILAAVTGRDVDQVLQRAGAAVGTVLAADANRVRPEVRRIIERLEWRRWTGDDVLAEDLRAALRGEPLAGRALAVDLDMLTEALEGDPDLVDGAYIDSETGELHFAFTDSDADDDEIDLEDARYVRIDRVGSREGWTDMAAFAEWQADEKVRARLERAIEGAGAFRRFRDAIGELDLVEEWLAFQEDRQLGRARDALADVGIRAV